MVGCLTWESEGGVNLFSFRGRVVWKRDYQTIYTVILKKKYIKVLRWQLPIKHVQFILQAKYIY